MKALPMDAMTNEKIWQLHSSDVCCARSFLLQEGCDTPIISHVWKFGIRNQRKPTYEVYLLNTEKNAVQQRQLWKAVDETQQFPHPQPTAAVSVSSWEQSHLKPSSRSFGKFFSVFIFQPLPTTSNPEPLCKWSNSKFSLSMNSWYHGILILSNI